MSSLITSGQTEGHDEAHRQAPSVTTLRKGIKITVMLCLLMTMITVIVTETMMQIKSKHSDGINGGVNDKDFSFGASGWHWT
jgi:hypothetical protein